MTWRHSTSAVCGKKSKLLAVRHTALSADLHRTVQGTSHLLWVSILSPSVGQCSIVEVPKDLTINLDYKLNFMQLNVINSDSLYCGFQPLSLVTRISSPLMTCSTHLMGRESLCCYMSTLQDIDLMFRAVLNSFLTICVGRFEPRRWQQLQVSARLSSERDCQIECQGSVSVVGSAYIVVLAYTLHAHNTFACMYTMHKL